MSDTPSVTDILPIVTLALQEDIGPGDASAALIPAQRQASAQVTARESGILCGRPWFDAVFHALDPAMDIVWHVHEGDEIREDTLIVSLKGAARALLSGERAALNLLQTLSGTATLTAEYARRLAGTPTRLLDTRKTLPGLRQAQKYAVRCGGGTNHRMGLYDMIMLKENHIAAAGGIAPAVQQAREKYPHLKIEVETETLEEIKQALEAGADIIMLDNFDSDTLKQAVQLIAGRALTEISGNVTLENLEALAGYGVDFISTGAITKHVRALDLSMRIIT